MKDVQIKRTRNKVECARGMVHIAMQMMNLLHLVDQNLNALLQLKLAVKIELPELS